MIIYKWITIHGGFYKWMVPPLRKPMETSISWCFQVKVRLEKLANFAADFVGSAQFEDVPFELTLGRKRWEVLGSWGRSGHFRFKQREYQV